MNELFFALEQIYRMTQIPIRCLDASGKIVLFNRGYGKDADPFFNGGFKESFIVAMRNRQLPLIEFEADSYAYGGLTDTSDCVVILGPVAAFTRSSDEIKSYAESCGIDAKDFFLCSAGVSVMGPALSTLQLIRHGQEIHGNDFFLENSAHEHTTYEVEAYNRANEEAEAYREGYSHEREFFDYVRTGDVEGLLARRRDTNKEKFIGRMAKAPVKHYEYMVCSAITLATRAAMEGGLNHDTAYGLSDVYLQRLELCATPGEMLSLHQEVSLNFTQQVKNIRQKKSPLSYVEKCKAYIRQNISKPFVVDDIADAVSLNKAHLSRIFTREEGMSIMAYARMVRIEVATRLLKYSDESIANIAEYLCFRSQSHFGKVFLGIVGTTPQKYRMSGQVTSLR